MSRHDFAFQTNSELRCSCPANQLLAKIGYYKERWGVQVYHQGKVKAFFSGGAVDFEIECRHCKREHAYTLDQRSVKYRSEENKNGK